MSGMRPKLRSKRLKIGGRKDWKLRGREGRRKEEPNRKRDKSRGMKRGKRSLNRGN